MEEGGARAPPSLSVGLQENQNLQIISDVDLQIMREREQEAEAIQRVRACASVGVPVAVCVCLLLYACLRARVHGIVVRKAGLGSA